MFGRRLIFGASLYTSKTLLDGKLDSSFLTRLHDETNALKRSGLFKAERIITSPQQAVVTVADGNEVINLCANNYLGLANHPDIIQAAHDGLEAFGYGMSSVRFICGTQEIHKRLEARLSEFLATDDTVLYSSCFDANSGLFEALFDEQDAIITDALNHASIIDGVRLCKAQRFIFQNNDMDDLRIKLKTARNCRSKIIVTDGVFSMDGNISNLAVICELADEFDALVMVDDSHAVGFMGESGRGTHEFHGVMGKIDIITGTLGKALGGASGGYTSGRKEIVEWLRQRSRPYLFSNTLAPVIAATSIKVLDLLESSPELRDKLQENTQFFRLALEDLGYSLTPGIHPIIPVMLGDAKLANSMAQRLLEEGVYAVGFSYPVVPKNQARIRTQMSAALERDHLDRAVTAFEKVGRELAVI